MYDFVNQNAKFQLLFQTATCKLEFVYEPRYLVQVM